MDGVTFARAFPPHEHWRGGGMGCGRGPWFPSSLLAASGRVSDDVPVTV